MTIENAAVRDRIAGLLRRYPALQPIETGEIIDFLKAGPPIDRGMLKGDPEFGPVLALVQRDHPEQFKLSVARQLLLATMLALPFLAICWLMLDKGA